ncbi:hypothetical protein [Actinomadura soli]|uniref:hypothetical protein n=1 Tax=Actinomadura soli TaxID=2508997 RepID=UPI002E2EB699|nr:hypothetical protein [Actinomadura soli]
MDRLESAAWQLAGGALCAFVLAVVLRDAGWRVGCAVVAVSVAAWSLAAPPVAGAALGLAGWLLVTGFDVGKDGGLTFSGTPDLIRLGLLVGAGLAASLAGRWPGPRGHHGPADQDHPAWEPRARDADVPSGAIEGGPARSPAGRPPRSRRPRWTSAATPSTWPGRSSMPRTARGSTSPRPNGACWRSWCATGAS